MSAPSPVTGCGMLMAHRHGLAGHPAVSQLPAATA